MTTKKAAVAMSGGMDSSLAAALLVEEGFQVVGVTLQLRCGQSASEEGWERSCCAASSVTRAKRVAHALGIPHWVVDAASEFEKEIVHPFCDAYAAGLTPNPCVDCNARIKFGFLLEKVRSLGYDLLATGHYARIARGLGRTGARLLRGLDPAKDQSYFLWRLTQDQLAAVEFPVGELGKDDVRRAVRERGLPVAGVRESQDVCFVPRGDHVSWLDSQLAGRETAGFIRDTSGRVLAKHGGVHRYTVGQRRGLGIAVGRPQYVVRIDPRDRSVIVGDDPDLWRTSLTATEVSFVSGEGIAARMRVRAKIRYQHEAAPAWIEPCGEGLTLEFDEPQRAVTPGQSVVFYQGEEVLGGGVIQ